MVKNPPANAGNARDTGLIPGLGRSSGEGIDNPLRYSCLGNPMDRGAWWATQSMQFQGVGASEVALVVKNLPASAGDVRNTGLIPGLGRSPGGSRGNPLQ